MYLGTLLYPVICETWNIPINRKRFMYGCVKPDITSLFFTHPHFYRISRKFIFKKIEKMGRKKRGSEKKNKAFSEELGVVLHYIADFFTSVHNIIPNRLKEHIAFEDALFIDFKSTVTVESVRSYFLFLTNHIKTVADVRTEITRLHKANLCWTATTSYDIHEILLACITAITGIMNAVSVPADKSCTAI
jgi:hypothetical protein